jgi:molybdopterin-synthase adenylyltransferase
VFYESLKQPSRGDLSMEKLRALPIQVLETDGGVILKRGRVEVKISGSYAMEAVRIVLNAAAGGATRDEIHQLFPAPERSSVDALVDHLISKRMLVEDTGGETASGGTESARSIFYWHFGLSDPEMTNRLNSQRLAIIGVNYISRQIAISLNASGVDNLKAVDYPLLRNMRLFDEAGELMAGGWPAQLNAPEEYRAGGAKYDSESIDCLIATSDFGGLSLLREWNEWCVINRRIFLPVVLQDLIGYVGPIVVPGETACFECFYARQDRHLADPDSRRRVEVAAFEGQTITGYLPSMASILGDIAVVELAKFVGLGPPLWQVGTLITVNLLASEMTPRKVLRVPRCRVCSPLHERASANTSKSIFR